MPCSLKDTEYALDALLLRQAGQLLPSLSMQTRSNCYSQTAAVRQLTEKCLIHKCSDKAGHKACTLNKVACAALRKSLAVASRNGLQLVVLH